MTDRPATDRPTDHPLNAKGLQCPLPVLRARKAIKAIAVGDTLTVEATDPGARKDFPAFCEATGNRLLSVAEEDGVLRFVIERVA
ncbi:sulfurtransferase TusA family protein [Azospirillum endophyticum]